MLALVAVGVPTLPVQPVRFDPPTPDDVERALHEAGWAQAVGLLSPEEQLNWVLTQLRQQPQLSVGQAINELKEFHRVLMAGIG